MGCHPRRGDAKPFQSGYATRVRGHSGVEPAVKERDDRQELECFLLCHSSKTDLGHVSGKVPKYENVPAIINATPRCSLVSLSVVSPFHASIGVRLFLIPRACSRSASPSRASVREHE